MLDELPALIAAGYEQVDEEDIVRLKWWGLYHDKPKIGTFMLRVKIPGGITSPAQLRAIGEISNRARPRRRRADDAPERAAAFHRASVRCPTSSTGCTRPGLTSAGACGDTVRNITGCPRRAASRTTSCSTRRRCSRRPPRSSTGTPTTPTCRASTRSRSPRAADALLRAGDQLHLPDRRDSRRRAGLRRARRRRALVGAADRARPRDLGRRRTRRSRCSRRSSTSGARTCATASPASSRGSKFMIDDIGPEGCAQRDREPSRSHASTTSSCRQLPPARQPPRCARAGRRPALRRRAGAPRARSAATR